MLPFNLCLLLFQAYLRRQVTPLFSYFREVTANWTKSPDKHTDR